VRVLAALLLASALYAGPAPDNLPLPERARQYLLDLLKIDTSNPPGRETRVAEYLKQVADSYGIPCELIGPDPRRLNFVARLKGSGKARPLLMMAHSDVVPAEQLHWKAPPFGAEVRDGMVYGRGAVDIKSLLAAELAVLVELKKRNIQLNRDVILLSEADEEAGSTGIQWLLRETPHKIDAEFAVNEGGIALDTTSGRIFQVQTAEKIPTRITLIARGSAGHGSLPRADNPIVRLSRAIARLTDADQPVRLNPTTRRYFRELAKTQDNRWLEPLLAKLENPTSAAAAANQIRARAPELEAMLRTTLSPTVLRAGIKVNVIPTTAEAQIDVRRMPSETREELLARFRQIVNDPEVEIAGGPGPQMPQTEPSSLTTALYRAIERVILRAHSEDVVIPYMSRGATDGAFLRARGMAVYGVPLFVQEGSESLAHGNDERISLNNIDDGVELLWQILMEVAGAL
jgi:acetylornithine deacetylase/succinyl-diaminopimelate desuccinylase-like protein